MPTTYKKAKHHHRWLEVGLTDECKHGCKVLRCACNETTVSHRRIYGCDKDVTPRLLSNKR